MVLNENYILNNGVEIPKLALGTWQIPDGDAELAVRDAIKTGYRHIDTAAAYGNEKGVARGIKLSGKARGEVFITTKIPADVKTYEGAKKVIEESLENLQTDYIDLMLIHSPKPWEEMAKGSANTYFEENLAVWKAMEEAYHDKKIRAIGVSNFYVKDIQNLLDNATVKPVCNQLRVHIGHVEHEVVEFCKKNDILITAYSPIATGLLLKHPLLTEIAAKYGVTLPQLCIRYDLQLGFLPMPKTTHIEFMRENAELDFTISDEDMLRLSTVEDVKATRGF